jgi:hypothetical protein
VPAPCVKPSNLAPKVSRSDLCIDGPKPQPFCLWSSPPNFPYSDLGLGIMSCLLCYRNALSHTHGPL